MDQATSTLIVASVMAGVFLVAWWRQVPHIASLTVAGIVGAFVAGEFAPWRHLVEGSFMFLDLVIVILTATIFIGLVREAGSLHAMIRDVIRTFSHRPLVLLSLMTFVVMLPGMLTGSGTAAVLAVGSMVGAVLERMGIPTVRAVSIVALAGIVGSFAPPVNIPAMAMANGINMPYVGLFVPLLIVSLPLGILSSLWIGGRYVRKGFDVDLVLAELDAAAEGVGPWRTYLPFVFVLGLMALTRVAPNVTPDLGVPLIFVIGSLVTILQNPSLRVASIAAEMVQEAFPVASILIGVGAFVQVMTLTGVQGLFVVTAITLPAVGLYVFTFFGFAVSGSLLGSYGSGTVFGIPVALAFLDRDPIIAIVGLSLLAAYSSLTPPTAIVGQASAVAMRYTKPYATILRHVAWPWIVASLVGILIVVFADRLSGFAMYS